MLAFWTLQGKCTYVTMEGSQRGVHVIVSTRVRHREPRKTVPLKGLSGRIIYNLDLTSACSSHFRALFSFLARLEESTGSERNRAYYRPTVPTFRPRRPLAPATWGRVHVGAAPCTVMYVLYPAGTAVPRNDAYLVGVAELACAGRRPNCRPE